MPDPSDERTSNESGGKGVKGNCEHPHYDQHGVVSEEEKLTNNPNYYRGYVGKPPPRGAD